jgi:hypothetical protein
MSDDLGVAPLLDDVTGWQMLMAEFKFGDAASRVPLTDLLRVASPDNANISSDRGVVRFDVRLRPSATEWHEYQLGTRLWNDLSWAQGIHGSGTGLRQTWCRIELQFQTEEFAEFATSKAPKNRPGRRRGPGRRKGGSSKPKETRDTREEDTTIPFFGSATIYHELHRS